MPYYMTLASEALWGKDQWPPVWTYWIIQGLWDLHEHTHTHAHKSLFLKGLLDFPVSCSNCHYEPRWPTASPSGPGGGTAGDHRLAHTHTHTYTVYIEYIVWMLARCKWETVSFLSAFFTQHAGDIFQFASTWQKPLDFIIIIWLWRDSQCNSWLCVLNLSGLNVEFWINCRCCTNSEVYLFSTVTPAGCDLW